MASSKRVTFLTDIVAHDQGFEIRDSKEKNSTQWRRRVKERMERHAAENDAIKKQFEKEDDDSFQRVKERVDYDETREVQVSFVVPKSVESCQKKQVETERDCNNPASPPIRGDEGQSNSTPTSKEEAVHVEKDSGVVQRRMERHSRRQKKVNGTIKPTSGDDDPFEKVKEVVDHDETRDVQVTFVVPKKVTHAQRELQDKTRDAAESSTMPQSKQASVPTVKNRPFERAPKMTKSPFPNMSRKALVLPPQKERGSFTTPVPGMAVDMKRERSEFSELSFSSSESSEFYGPEQPNWIDYVDMWLNGGSYDETFDTRFRSKE